MIVRPWTKKLNRRSHILLGLLTCGLGSIVGCASVPKAATPPVPPTSAAVGNNTTIVAIAPSAPAPSNCSLPQFLGLPGLAKGTGGILYRLGSRLMGTLDLTGRFPALQPQPPVLPLSDPANLDAGAPPAVQAAAEIKQEEDAAPQKIMAIRYLATLGCGGCYEKVEDALLEGLSDCTEEVRFEAVKALQCKPECGCKYCSSPSCCSAKVRKRLQELTTCEKEPSIRIRRVARMALACCQTKPLSEADVPREGPPSPNDAALSKPNALSPLFDGIQLVSFEATSAQPGDMILAKVNGEAIYESQVLPLVESKLRAAGNVNTSDPAVRRKQLVAEITQVIDWKLMSQQARNEVQLASTATASSSAMSPEEIQAWFERRIAIDANIPSSEILAHYEVHKDRFRVPARVRWERASVVLDECPNREVGLKIANYLRNRSAGIQVETPAEFARDRVEMQTYGWTELASLEPVAVRATLKQLPAGQVSTLVETPDEIHVLRVLERQDEGYFPLPAVADRIRSDIINERKKAAGLRAIAQLRSQSQIWTVFDVPAASTGTVSTGAVSTGTAPISAASTGTLQSQKTMIPASTDWQRN